jgi:hypothetical protein
MIKLHTSDRTNRFILTAMDHFCQESSNSPNAGIETEPFSHPVIVSASLFEVRFDSSEEQELYQRSGHKTTDVITTG